MALGGSQWERRWTLCNWYYQNKGSYKLQGKNQVSFPVHRHSADCSWERWYPDSTYNNNTEKGCCGIGSTLALYSPLNLVSYIQLEMLASNFPPLYITLAPPLFKGTLEYLNSIKLEPYVFPFCHFVYKTMPGTSKHCTKPILYTFSQKWIWIGAPSGKSSLCSCWLVESFPCHCHSGRKYSPK